MSQVLRINNNDLRIMYKGDWGQDIPYTYTETSFISELRILFRGTVNT